MERGCTARRTTRRHGVLTPAGCRDTAGGLGAGSAGQGVARVNGAVAVRRPVGPGQPGGRRGVRFRHGGGGLVLGGGRARVGRPLAARRGRPLARGIGRRLDGSLLPSVRPNADREFGRRRGQASGPRPLRDGSGTRLSGLHRERVPRLWTGVEDVRAPQGEDHRRDRGRGERRLRDRGEGRRGRGTDPLRLRGTGVRLLVGRFVIFRSVGMKGPGHFAPALSGELTLSDGRIGERGRGSQHVRQSVIGRRGSGE